MIYNTQYTTKEGFKEGFNKIRGAEERGTYIRHSNNTNPIQIYKYINIFLYTKNNQSIRNTELLSSNLKVLSTSNLNSINFGIINPAGLRE